MNNVVGLQVIVCLPFVQWQDLRDLLSLLSGLCAVGGLKTVDDLQYVKNHNSFI